MIRIFLLSVTVLVIVQTIDAQNAYNPNKYQEIWAPEPRLVDTGIDDQTPPSDAIVLFDGSTMDQWVSARKAGGEVQWKNENGILTVAPKTGSIKTKQEFGDCKPQARRVADI